MTIRNCCGSLSFLSANLSVLLIPMSFCFVISNMQAFVISFFAFLFLKEPILKIEIIAMSACLFLVAFMSQFTQKNKPKANIFDSETSSFFLFYFGLFTMVLAVVMTAFNGILGKKLKANFFVICAWYGINGIVIFGVIIFIRDAFVAEKALILNHTFSGWCWAAAGATSNSMAQIAWTKAFSVSKSGTIGLFGNLSVIYTLITDVLIFKLSFGAIEVICALLILSITLSVPLYNAKMKNQKR